VFIFLLAVDRFLLYWCSGVRSHWRQSFGPSVLSDVILQYFSLCSHRPIRILLFEHLHLFDPAVWHSFRPSFEIVQESVKFPAQAAHSAFNDALLLNHASTVEIEVRLICGVFRASGTNDRPCMV
jgi:hypothetical protein